ncbi:1,3-beta-glucanosyltransferase [Coprinopsis marcescibilis]|uniref:1,3-beta-glucanosyltransferase n=1 Tax=Coprinopsis marcescibilis TaxID=230819 RepID=A0A5C3LDL3_COPMA|nr:1,3-beta-glucanosyltransferase [Coprinopsis marcescibilis]
MLVSLRAFAALSALVTAVQAIPKVTRTGRYLYQEGGTRFYIKGIGYQPQGERHDSDDNPFGEPGTFVDPLADPAGCTRDLAHFQEASINTVRVYSVNSTLNHDECMQMFSDAGIYVILDLSIPLIGSIDRLAPSWSSNVLNVYLDTINAFTKYDNVIVYNIGNEVVLGETLNAAPYVKAAARDIKAYLKSINSDALVGYAAINGASTFRKGLADYLSCGSEETAIDIYGLNEYSWCGADGSLEGSGYSTLTAEFADYNVVAYFSEYGCVRSPPRVWTEVDALFSSDMSDVWSGGIAFNYFPAESDGQYGLVTISASGDLTPTSEFTALGERYTAATGPDSPSRDSVPASTYPACGTTLAASNTLPGTPDDDSCGCLQTALSCQFRPRAGLDATGVSDIVGELINVGCSLLDGAGGSCADIGGDGLTGVYGRVSGCDPQVKLSYVMSQFYEAEGRAAEACGFSGNATVNDSASSTDSATAIASSCVANPAATLVPDLPSSTTGGAAPTNTRNPAGGNTGNGNNSTGGNTNPNSGAIGLDSTSSLVGVGAMAVIGVISGLWTLL